jgi:AcrR family transcriptional regulator
MTGRNVTRAAKPREQTARKRMEIVRAATEVFGNKGYSKGSLADIAEIVGMTHAGVLHHFGSKDALLLEVLLYRDETDVEDLAGHHMPGGLDLFRHLIATARRNEGRPGIVQAFAVLSAESVTDDHPAKEFFLERYEKLRGELTVALTDVCDPNDPPCAEDVAAAAASIIAIMDGLQIQWLLRPDKIRLAEASAFAIEAILVAAIQGKRRRVL